MFNHYKKVALALALASASMSAHAVQADITVWADVDPTLALLKADGTPLTDVVEMTYRAGTGAAAGLAPWTEQVRVFTNDTDKDINVRLGADAALQPHVAAPGAVAIPLTVSLNAVPITVAGVDFTKASLYPGSEMDGASKSMELKIAQTKPGTIAFGGQYRGMVTILMVQKS